ncbi:MAG TPA: hypothetical protein VGR06_27820 [Actinophytocola sp.]|jgi:mercuric ion transport protein|uniref:hypothetical protein n=1 Tax=Actinophytocola sp. TaxID=1872138 RepID=UPI002DFB8345|nr:hypothetical protein [Actinophytocola sp.]
MTPTGRPDRRWTRVGVAAVVACGVCCAVPLIAVLSGIGVVASLGAVLEVVEWLSVALAVLALGGAALLWLRRRRRQACQVPDRVVSLGMPGPTRRAPR